MVVLYPEDNVDIEPKEYGKVHLRERIGKRLAGYRASPPTIGRGGEAGGATPEIRRFEGGWEEMLGRIGVDFRSW